MCGFPCCCNCSLFDFTWNQADLSAPAVLTAIADGWYKVDAKLPATNFWVLVEHDFTDYTSAPTTDSDIFTLDCRIKNSAGQTVATFTVDRDFKVPQLSSQGTDLTSGYEHWGDVTDLSLTTNATSTAKDFNRFNLHPGTDREYGFVFERESARLHGGIIGWSANSAWPSGLPDPVDISNGPAISQYNWAQAPFVWTAIGDADVLPFSATGKLTLEIKPSWDHNMGGDMFRLRGQRASDTTIEGTPRCSRIAGYRLRDDQVHPRHTVTAFTTPEGAFNFSDPAFQFVNWYELDSPALSNSLARDAAMSVEPAKRDDFINGLDRGVSKSQSKTRFSQLVEYDETAQLEYARLFWTDDDGAAGNKSSYGAVTPRNFVNAEFELEYSDAGGGDIEIFVRLRCRYVGATAASGSASAIQSFPIGFNQSIDYEPPGDGASGNYQLARVLTANAVVRDSYTSMTLTYRKTVPAWTGTPPTVSFTSSDRDSSLILESFYVTSAELDISGVTVNSAGGGTWSGTATYNYNATAIDPDDFAFTLTPRSFNFNA